MLRRFNRSGTAQNRWESGVECGATVARLASNAKAGACELSDSHRSGRLVLG
jgi:hypothetical protein